MPSEVPGNRVSDIVRQRRDVSADAAVRLGRYFDVDPVLAEFADGSRFVQGGDRERLFWTAASGGGRWLKRLSFGHLE
jgi:hypothetical protein